MQGQEQGHIDEVTAARGHFATTRNGEVSEQLQSTHSNRNNGSGLLKDGWSPEVREVETSGLLGSEVESAGVG